MEFKKCDKMDTWFLEHVTSKDRVTLKTGDNTIGRHSSCKYTLKYAFLSRLHVNLRLNPDNVIDVILLNALNGVYVNDALVTKDDSIQLREGDQICLGVAPSDEAVPLSHAVFVLKRISTASEVCLISDDEEDPSNDSVHKENSSACGSATKLHMPKLPPVKEELINEKSNVVRDIFGDVDESILRPMMDINPYVFNNLQKTNPIPIADKMHDGDIFEIPNDYDDHLAMSQAVLQEIKEDMDEDIENDGNNDEKPDLNLLKKEPQLQQYDDDEEIIISDDEEEEDCAAGRWSMLLSQNIVDTSQAFPIVVDDDDNDNDNCQIVLSSDDDDNEGKENLLKTQLCRVWLRRNQQDEGKESPRINEIDSLLSDEEEPLMLLRKTRSTLRINSSQESLNSNTVDCDAPDNRSSPPSMDKNLLGDHISNQESIENKQNVSSSNQKGSVEDSLKTMVDATPKKQISNSTKTRRQSVVDKHEATKSKKEASAEESLKIKARRQTMVDVSPRKQISNHIKTRRQSMVDEHKTTTSTSKEKVTSSKRETSAEDSLKIKARRQTLVDVSPRKQISKNIKIRRQSLVDEHKATSSNKETSAENSLKIKASRQTMVDVSPRKKISNDPKTKHRRQSKADRHKAKTSSKEEDSKNNKSKSRNASKKEDSTKIKIQSKPLINCKSSVNEPTKPIEKTPLKNVERKTQLTDAHHLSSKKRSKQKESTVPVYKSKTTINDNSKDSKKDNKSEPHIKHIGPTFSQQLNNADTVSCPLKRSRPPERKDAALARSKRTCNRITFADLELEKERRNRFKIIKKVRFDLNLKIHHIDRVEGANRKVGQRKDTKKLSVSTYAERREWAHSRYSYIDHSEEITADILRWSNQWLKVRDAEIVAKSDLLMPMPHEFQSYKHYKGIILPLMKVELLSTIERDYKMATEEFQVKLISHFNDRDRCLLVTKINSSGLKRFDLYTLRMENNDQETFASMPRLKRMSDTSWELTFQILLNDYPTERLRENTLLTVRPIVDNIRVDLGAFNAVFHIGRSPLFRKILKPNANQTAKPKQIYKPSSYRGAEKLSSHQEQVILQTHQILVDNETPSVTLIHGPPGTGKSSVITNLILQCMYDEFTINRDRKILLCAHSNAAVDNIADSLRRVLRRMEHNRFEVVRFGLYDRMSSVVRCLSLEALLEKERSSRCKRLSDEDKENLKSQKQHLENECKELKKRLIPGTSLEDQLRNKEKQLRQVKDLLNPQLAPHEIQDLSRSYIYKANIVCTTLSSCVKLATLVDYFDICIIDEATQCTEPWSLLPLRFGVHALVLVGDTQQLPATVLSQKAAEFGLANSMFDRIQRSVTNIQDGNFVHTKIFHLNEQFRMHPEICKWPNQYFYESKLINAEITNHLKTPITPYCVINLRHTRDTCDAASRSIKNVEEARFIADLLIELDKLMPSEKFSYGLITPYTSHATELRCTIDKNIKISPSTIDAYQGLQRDVIILSNARTRGAGFLANYQRLNVAITRPRRVLIICGNFTDLEAVPMWGHLLDDARKRKIYFDLEQQDCKDISKTLMPKLLAK